MQSDDQLPLAAWGQALAAARTEQGLGVVETARELMLSPAQLRNIESGTLQSFHGSGYYLRAVQKYATRLNVVLDPAVEALPLTDSQLGMQRLNKNLPESHASATATLSRRQSTLDNGLSVSPFRSRSSRIGMVLGVILVFAVALGVYLSAEEGWPNKQTSQTADGMAQQTPSGESVQAITVPITPDLDQPVSLSDQSPRPATEPLLVSPTATRAVSVTEPLTLPAPAPEVAPPPAPEPPPPPADIFEARFTADCWVEVRYKDGRVEQKVYTERDILTVPVDEIKGLVLGNAAAVRAQRRGQSFDVMTYAGGKNVSRISEADLR
uniref:RodZ domain-containing protein n=1 Tax=Orrella sp. TaxID=1921583 RepID=UPI00404822D6